MKKITILAFMIMSFIGQSQDFKFGKVSKEELKETSHPNHPEANAVVLFKKQYTNFPFSEENGFERETEYYERIKIYNKEGYDWATKRIELYNESSSMSQNLIGLKGYTYKLVNGKVEKSKLKNENIFKEDVNKYWSSKTFTMPGLAEGCIIEFEYKVKSTFLSIDDVVLQYDIPINKIEIDIITPEYFNYNKFVSPRAAFLPKIEESKKDRKETVVSKVRTGFYVPKSTVNSSSFVFKENVVKIYMEDLPALVEEPFTDNVDNYRAKVAFEYAFYKGPDGTIKNYATNWDKVISNIYNNEDFGGQLSKSNYFEDDINNLIKSATTDSEKMQLIFDFVKTKIKKNDFIGYTSENGVKKAYKEGSGNTADINLMLIAMLRYAKISANPVLVSTRNNGVPLFPTRTGFNYVICAVEAQDQLVLLDATEQHTMPNVLPVKAINWQGRLIREDGTSTWVGLNPKDISKKVVSISLNLEEDLSAKGKIRQFFTNYQAYNYRKNFYSKSKEDLILYKESQTPGLVVVGLDAKNVKSKTKPISESYGFTYDEAAEKIGDNIYISPLLFLNKEENPFTQDSRGYPIDFIYPTSEKQTVTIIIPEGYKVESLPESTKLNFNDTSASFSYLIKQTGNTIQLSKNLEINKTIILPESYSDFKSFYQFMVEKNLEKIVLKKI
jgi:hypothetical protein